MSYEKYIKKEGKFEYLEKGEGHTIVVLHGLFWGPSAISPIVIDQFF